MASPIFLALETSQRTASVALRDASGEVHQEPLTAVRRHDDDLLPAIDRLLNRHGMSPRSLDVVAVSIGPGGFTGLRIAVTTAKMLAQTLGVDLVAVPSALVAAVHVDDHVGSMLIALASKGDTFWATTVQRQQAHEPWELVGNPGIVAADNQPLEHLSLVLGDAHLPETMRARCEAAGVVVQEPRFDARACLEISRHFFDAGQTVDSLSLAPLYPRQPEAVTLWQQHREQR